MPELTVVVGIDQKTARQLLISWRTWRKFRPEMWRMPWLIFYDWLPPNGLYREDVERLIGEVMQIPDARLIKWPSQSSQYETQRERMLTGFVHVPALHVETDWWMKIDTDALALRESDWLPSEWFEPRACGKCGRREISSPREPLAPVCSECVGDPHIGKLNAWIASPWSYTKPAGQMAALDAWADNVPGLSDFERLNLPFEPDARTCRHPRMASWLSFYNAEWSRQAAAYAASSLGPEHIPAPSQDGYHFYVAARRGDAYLRTKMKRRGWTNCPRISTLAQKAKEALNE